MKKILIISSDMNVGGIQKALLELLKALSTEGGYKVSLFCCNLSGGYLERIPAEIEIIAENKYARMSTLTKQECKRMGKKYYLLRMIFSFWSRFFSKRLPAAILCKLIGKLKGEYDVAISYSQPIEEHSFANLTNEIALTCVRAKKKVTFLHCDFGSYGGNTRCNRKLYKKFDSIAAVSDSVGKRFSEIMPELSDRVFTAYNFCDTEEVIKLSNINAVEYKKFTFVTVARLSAEKGLLRCIPIFDRLKKSGHDFEWHIVGNGPLKTLLKEEIEKHNLSDVIILEGEQLNPYRYMKNANYFLLPSLHEAAPVVFDEALALDLPVLTTNTLSAIEMVENRKIGIVCDNDNESIYEMLFLTLSEKPQFDVKEKEKKELRLEQFATLCK